jgi:hypothetical protein
MNYIYRVVFLFNISLLFFSFTYTGAEHMFTLYDFFFIFIFFILTICLQSTVLFLFHESYLKNYVLSFFCTINIISLHLVFVEFIHLLPFYLEILIFIFCFLLLIFIINIISESRIMSIIFVISPLLIVITTIILNLQTPNLVHDKKLDLQNNNPKKINFNSKPNVYFISFESMVPLSIAQKHFKEEKFAYHDVLQKKFYSFKNAFTLAFPSKESLNSLLAFDQKKYLLLKKENKHLNFFTGVEQSPLLKIFRDNNYDLSTFYDNFWFGRNKGKYIDNYFVNESGGKFNTCAFDTGYGFHYKVSFLGYCLLPETIKFKIISLLLRKNLNKTTTIQKIIEIMEANIKKDKPQFFMAHNINPGHTGDYIYGRKGDFVSFQKYYKEKSIVVKNEIKQIIDFIEKKDPNAILFIYADHGPKLSSGLEFEDNNVFKITDSFAVYAGIYPKEKCIKYANIFYETKKFATLIDASKIIINCIKKDEKAMNFDNKQFFMDTGGEIKYFNNEQNIILGYDNINLKPENYLYE